MKQTFREYIRHIASKKGISYAKALRLWKDRQIHLRNQMRDVKENERKNIVRHPHLRKMQSEIKTA